MSVTSRFWRLRMCMCAWAAAALVAGLALPAHADNEPADPALQQVVSDDEPIDQETKVVLDHGHSDIGPRLIDGTWELMIRDDTVTPSVWRPLSNVVFKVSDRALQTLPEDPAYAFTGAKGGEQVYAIPQSEIEGVPWLGWSTQSPAVVGGVDGQMKLTFEGHEGDGQFTNFYQAGNFGGPEQNWTSGVAEAQVLNVDLNTHVHTNWVFTAPGIHLVRVSARATLADGAEVADSQVLRFAVGDSASVDDAWAATWKGSQTPQAHPSDDPQVTGDTPESSHSVLIGVGVGLVLAGLLGILAAVLIIATTKKRRAAAEREALGGHGDDA